MGSVQGEVGETVACKPRLLVISIHLYAYEAKILFEGYIKHSAQ